METKQHATKKQNKTKQWVNEEIRQETKKYLKTNDNEDNYSKIYEMPQKQCLEGNSEKYRPSSKKKKNLKLTI